MRGVLLALMLAGSAHAETLEAYRQQASGWLLSGQRLPRDYRVQLMRMESADRIRAIAYLRRIGLLTGSSWSLDDLLRDPILSEER